MRAAAHRPLGVGDDQRLVVLERCAEAVAPIARAARAVEREKLRRWRGGASAVVGALEAFGEAEDFGLQIPRFTRDDGSGARDDRSGARDDNTITVALAERGAHRVSQASTRFVAHGETIDDDEELPSANVTSIASLISSSRCLMAPSRTTRTNPCARRFSTTTSCVTSEESRSGNAT